MVPPRCRLVLILAVVVVFPPPLATAQVIAPDTGVGVLLMAHGGGAEWNAAIAALIQEIRPSAPVEVALGMADRATLQRAVAALETRGLRRIVVVRLFVSGRSFAAQTEYLLGLRDEAPEFLIDSDQTAGHGASDQSAGHGAHAPTPGPVRPVEHRSTIVLSPAGLVDAPMSGAIVAERALALAQRPERETVLILAHGMGRAADNDALLAALDRRADAVRRAAPFRAVRVETLREDWSDHRVRAEARIREGVAAATVDGGRAIVIPFRVSGFGPYAEVLEGLDFAADRVGLLPHPAVARWVLDTAVSSAERAGWIHPICCASR